MRLSEWRKAAPDRDCMNARVVGVLEPLLIDLGTGQDPECWVVWGEDPAYRYTVLAPTRAGLVNVGVRPNIPEEGARANGKLVRWSRVQLAELSVEAAGGHRLVAVQVEGQVLKGMDVEADRIAEFVRGLVAAVDGREWIPSDGIAAAPAPRPAAAAAKPAAKGTAPKKPGAAKAPARGSAPRPPRLSSDTRLVPGRPSSD